MKLKKGVNLQGVRPELVFAMMIVAIIYKEKGSLLVITSIVDGKHSDTSLHYTGCAFDCRIKNTSTAQVGMIKSAIKEALTEDFDVVLEKTHIHIEYQPRFKP